MERFPNAGTPWNSAVAVFWRVQSFQRLLPIQSSTGPFEGFGQDCCYSPHTSPFALKFLLEVVKHISYVCDFFEAVKIKIMQDIRDMKQELKWGQNVTTHRSFQRDVTPCVAVGLSSDSCHHHDIITRAIHSHLRKHKQTVTFSTLSTPLRQELRIHTVAKSAGYGENIGRNTIF